MSRGFPTPYLQFTEDVSFLLYQLSNSVNNSFLGIGFFLGQVVMDLESVVRFVVCLGACFIASIIGSVFTIRSIPDWYPSLKKPPYTPPNRVFGPIWMILYVLMAISVFLTWERGLSNPGELAAFVLFWIQLIFNVLWSIVFFGLKQQGWAVIIITVLWILILASIVTAFRVSAWAGILLVPYLTWVTIASYLNIGIWQLNRKIVKYG